MFRRVSLHRFAQLLVIVMLAGALKYYYSVTSVNGLRWVLAPTTALVEFLTGRQFQFEPHAGYMSSDHTFLIAASCAGVNFLITAFLMLALRRWWRSRSSTKHRTVRDWMNLPLVAGLSYVTTVVANTVRISLALELQTKRLNVSWLDADQLHRLEGVLVYFGFLLLLFVVNDRFAEEPRRQRPHTTVSLLRRGCFPLAIYYAITLGVPLANGGFRRGTDFFEHSLFVAVTPLLLMLVVFVVQKALAADLRWAQTRTNSRQASPVGLLSVLMCVGSTANSGSRDSSQPRLSGRQW